MMNRKPQNMRASSSSGFTLIELTIVIVIIGLLMVPLTQMYNLYLKEKRVLATQEAIENSVRSMALFSPKRFPCPSDRSLPPTHVDYGYEQCTGVPACTAAYQGICRADGTRDTAIDADALLDPILIGGVPFRTRVGGVTIALPLLNRSDTLDGWNRKLTYAVSERLTDIAKTGSLEDFKYGVIAAIDEHGNPTAGISAIGDAQLVILSHGPTGAGAFSESGASLPCAATGQDRENCDNDSTFVKALGQYDANDANFFDDQVHFFLERSGSLWASLTDSGGLPTPHLNNMNNDFVGVNLLTPGVKLDVGGTLRADTVKSQSYCDKSGTNCFPPDYFDTLKTSGAITNSCPTSGAMQGSIMTGISSLQVQCSKPTLDLPPGYPGLNCSGVGNWLAGILTNGCIICTNGVEVCP